MQQVLQYVCSITSALVLLGQDYVFPCSDSPPLPNTVTFIEVCTLHKQRQMYLITPKWTCNGLRDSQWARADWQCRGGRLYKDFFAPGYCTYICDICWHHYGYQCLTMFQVNSKRTNLGDICSLINELFKTDSIHWTQIQGFTDTPETPLVVPDMCAIICLASVGNRKYKQRYRRLPKRFLLAVNRKKSTSDSTTIH